MCGIVGLFLKDDALKPQLGEMLSAMLLTMTDRGPDSAGIAIYGDETAGQTKITVQSGTPDSDFPALEKHIQDQTHLVKDKLSFTTRDTHAVIVTADTDKDHILTLIRDSHPNIRVMSQPIPFRPLQCCAPRHRQCVKSSRMTRSLTLRSPRQS